MLLNVRSTFPSHARHLVSSSAYFRDKLLILKHNKNSLTEKYLFTSMQFQINSPPSRVSGRFSLLPCSVR